MILLRVALLIIGGGLGAIAMWQGLQAMQVEFAPVWQVFFYLAAVILLGGVFSLSAPVARIAFIKISAFFKKRFKSFKAVDIAGIASGLVVGLAFALIIEFTFVLFLPILAIRIIIAIIIGITVAFVTAIAISTWISKGQEKSIDEKRKGAYKGFLLTENALAHPQIISICKFWLEGDIFVLAQTADRIAKIAEQSEGADSTANANFISLFRYKMVSIFTPSEYSFETNALTETAKTKKYKLVVTNSDNITPPSDKSMIVLNLDDK